MTITEEQAVRAEKLIDARKWAKLFTNDATETNIFAQGAGAGWDACIRELTERGLIRLDDKQVP